MPALVRPSAPQSPQASIHLPRESRRRSEGRSSNASTIASGVGGGVAVIGAAIAALAYLRGHSQSPPAESDSAGVGASQSQQPLSDDVVPSRSSGSSMRMGLYVRDFVPCVVLVFLMWHFLPISVYPGPGRPYYVPWVSG